MSLTVELKIGRRVIGEAVIVNLGHPETGEHCDEDDLRLYRYDVFHDGKVVCKDEVEHRRGDGAWVLVKKVLNHMEGLRA